jgi:hypothetical protein
VEAGLLVVESTQVYLRPSARKDILFPGSDGMGPVDPSKALTTSAEDFADVAWRVSASVRFPLRSLTDLVLQWC